MHLWEVKPAIAIRHLDILLNQKRFREDIFVLLLWKGFASLRIGNIACRLIDWKNLQHLPSERHTFFYRVYLVLSYLLFFDPDDFNNSKKLLFIYYIGVIGYNQVVNK